MLPAAYRRDHSSQKALQLALFGDLSSSDDDDEYNQDDFDENYFRQLKQNFLEENNRLMESPEYKNLEEKHAELIKEAKALHRKYVNVGYIAEVREKLFDLYDDLANNIN